MSDRKVQAGIAGVLLIAAFALLANDGRHHWHEFRYLYSATFYSTPELMRGVFDPGPAPVRTPEQVAVWYATELLHIYLLKQLVALFGMGLKSYTIIKTLYATMFVAAVGLIWKTLRDLGMSQGRSALVAGLFLISPLAIYLGFKLMGEVPSLFFSACALALFTAGMRRTDFLSRPLLSGVAGLFLALSMLASAKMPLLFLGFWAAMLLAWAQAEMKKSIIKAGIISGTVFLVAVPVGFTLLGGSVDIYLEAFTAFLGFAKPLPMWMFAIFNLGLFGMGLWLFLPLAWLSPEQRYRRFFLVWLAFSAVPILIMAANFLEPRYLVTALIPFAGLAALGLEELWDYLRALNWGRSLRAVMVGILGMIVIGGAAVAQPLMPYESDTDSLIQAVQSEAPRPESAVILVPWNYSDFHFLRFAFPDRPIYLVQSAANERGQAVHDLVWTHRFAEMYGDHYLGSAAAVPPEFFQRKLLYVGWTILPSLENLREFLTTLRLTRLAGNLDSSRFLNHMAQSWVWQDPRFRMRETAHFGQYRIYEVTLDH
jgi:Dolichyl-phosphate-mannose-protein mannosyltransferase